MANLSILGLYNYDNSVMLGFQVPAGMSLEDVRDSILIECAELEVIYPDIEIMRKAVTMWTRSRLPMWEKLYDTTRLEYNPIENYERQEDWNDTQKTSLEGHNLYKGLDTTEERTVGFNGAAGGGLGESPRDSSSTTANHDTTTKGSNEGESTHKGRIHGNIGVTTTQTMIEQERKIDAFDMTRYIVEEFKRRFCILVY